MSEVVNLPPSQSKPQRRINRRSRSSRVNYKKLAGEDETYNEFDSIPAPKGIKVESFTIEGSKDSEPVKYKNKPSDSLHGYYGYGNKHIRLIVNNNFDDASFVLQVVSDGSQLTAEAICIGTEFDINNPILVTDTPESIGMTMPKNLSVRDVANYIGYSFSINVMDVSTQEELPDWTMRDLVDYFECPIRKKKMKDYEKTTNIDHNTKNLKRRKATTTKSMSQDDLILPKVLNQISLEFSKTPLISLVQSPEFVRNIDWIDIAWPKDRRQHLQYPQVQYYCLTSTAGCYTDFHIDFGGTSVWYHVISGQKTFLLIPPTDANLHKYEEWICNPKQSDCFFANLVDKCFKIHVSAGKTLIIPTGWIHAVYTPVDSVVIGGNFLHSLNIPGQLKIHCIETRTHVPQKFRFPFFRQINFYAASVLLQKIREGPLYDAEKKGLPELIEALKLWNLSSNGEKTVQGSIAEVAHLAAMITNCETAKEMIQELESLSAFVKTPINVDYKNLDGSSHNKSIHSRVKLKLSFKPKYTESPNIMNNKISETKTTPKFQIFVPKEPVFSVKIEKKVSKHKQNDLSYFSESSEDEWKPKSKRRKRRLHIPVKQQSNKQNVDQLHVTNENTINNRVTHPGMKEKHIELKRLIASDVKRSKANQVFISKRGMLQASSKKKHQNLRARLKRK